MKQYNIAQNIGINNKRVNSLLKVNAEVNWREIKDDSIRQDEALPYAVRGILTGIGAGFPIYLRYS